MCVFFLSWCLWDFVSEYVTFSERQVLAEEQTPELFCTEKGITQIFLLFTLGADM